ncbi:Inner membrane protein YqaA [Pandoraea terrae]|uniref:Inner membrane protein YqaA n=1 Tax=Pandoraea terrae TaxID=1537710 RepID=A0A5E4U3D6_9BURK|nr:YqaA family protein [Pandoraea terrae]VVD92639.1 Inner membrane protein YqaA [Pandoraea terrae]
MEPFIPWLFGLLALPTVGLPAIFLIALISATLLPLGSEPAVFGYIAVNPGMFWATIFVATAGNTIGGMIDWWMGFGAKLAVVRVRKRRWAHGHARNASAERRVSHGKPALGKRYVAWMRRHGAPVLLLSWLPGIGDPLCTLAGWLRLPWRTCLLYMTIGKFLRYVIVTTLLLNVPASFWEGVFAPLKHLLA